MPKIANHLNEKVFWALIAILLLAIPLAVWLRDSSPHLPILGKVTAFSLVDENHKPFTDQSLANRIWVVNFIFTSCPDVCPVLTKKMKHLQTLIEEGKLFHVGLLSITVDPLTDTPEKLKTYSQSHGANPKIWTFVTGETQAIEDVVMKGFKMAMGKSDENLFSVMHGERFVLLDEKQQIRGYFEAKDAGVDFASLEKIIRGGRIL